MCRLVPDSVNSTERVLSIEAWAVRLTLDAFCIVLIGVLVDEPRMALGFWTGLFEIGPGRLDLIGQVPDWLLFALIGVPLVR